MRAFLMLPRRRTGVTLRLRDKDPNASGLIDLVFTKQPSFELAGWKIIDAQGLETKVDLAEISRPDSLDAGLFKREMLFKRRL